MTKRSHREDTTSSLTSTVDVFCMVSSRCHLVLYPVGLSKLLEVGRLCLW
jgi:hypothetical protein